MSNNDNKLNWQELQREEEYFDKDKRDRRKSKPYKRTKSDGREWYYEQSEDDDFLKRNR